jgi:hypothetical protein
VTGSHTTAHSPRSVEDLLRRDRVTLGPTHVRGHTAWGKDGDADVSGRNELPSPGGRVRCIAASNKSAGRLAEAPAISDPGGGTRFVALQVHDNIAVLQGLEGELAGLWSREERIIPCFRLCLAAARGGRQLGIA